MGLVRLAGTLFRDEPFEVLESRLEEYCCIARPERKENKHVLLRMWEPDCTGTELLQPLRYQLERTQRRWRVQIVAISAMGLLLGGPIALKREGQFGEELIVLFMFLTFFITAVTEIFLYRQLSRLTAQPRFPPALPAPLPTAAPAEYYAPQPRSLAEPRTLAEPLPSVTENTTRTLGHSRDEPGRKDYS